jgi:hypothetical protein
MWPSIIVGACVDMSGTFIGIGLLIAIRNPTYPRRSLWCEAHVLCAWTTRIAASYLHNRGQTFYAILVTHHVLFTRFVLLMSLCLPTLVT